VKRDRRIRENDRLFATLIGAQRPAIVASPQWPAILGTCANCLQSTSAHSEQPILRQSVSAENVIVSVQPEPLFGRRFEPRCGQECPRALQLPWSKTLSNKKRRQQRKGKRMRVSNKHLSEHELEGTETEWLRTRPSVVIPLTKSTTCGSAHGTTATTVSRRATVPSQAAGFNYPASR
jgi:hypothetical protein